jgi:hypothetical protein
MTGSRPLLAVGVFSTEIFICVDNWYKLYYGLNRYNWGSYLG